MMIKLLIFSSLLAFVLPQGALAQTGSGDSSRREARQIERQDARESAQKALEEYRAAREELKLAALKKYAEEVINRRIKLLQSYKSRVRSASSCSNHQAITDQLNNFIDAAVLRLEALKAKLPNATTIDDLRQIIKDALEGQKVFGTIAPAINGACLSQRLINLIDGRLQEAIDKLKEADLDTSGVETLAGEAKALAEQAYTSYTAIISSPADSTRDDFTQAKNTLGQARAKLQELRRAISALIAEYRQSQSSATDSAAGP